MSIWIIDNIKMLYYGITDVSEGIDVQKTSESKECDVYSLNKGFKFQPNVWNGYHNLLMVSLNLSNIVVLKTENADYRYIIAGIAKVEL